MIGGASGHGVLFTTHNPNQALRYANRALLLRDGYRFAGGPVERILMRSGLEALYQTEIEEVGGAPNEGRAFLPR